MSRAVKTSAKDDIRQLTGPERSAVLMLALGEDHGTHLWQLMDEDEIKEVTQLMSNLGTISSSRGRKGPGRIRLADVGHRLADGFL